MDKPFLSEAEQQEVLAAIKQAELNTSGEIRVHIEGKCKFDVMDRATNVFETLGMTKTKLRNGVLIYLAIDDKKFAILGDKGIDEKVPDGFWAEVKDLMQAHFKKGQFAKGLSNGIIKAGSQLKAHFPFDDNSDSNELSDTISFGTE